MNDLVQVMDQNPNVDENGRDARLFERNEAILAQTIEIKPFEYDLRDHTADIKRKPKSVTPKGLTRINPICR